LLVIKVFYPSHSDNLRYKANSSNDRMMIVLSWAKVGKLSD
jgi:hypothetical protein